jgi:tRNA(Ile)-lysidine synthase
MCATQWPVSGSACAADAIPAHFAAAMADAGGWEEAPLLAVGLSGGADSLCLALLAAGWARNRGGRVLALVLDHGLRPAAVTEARLAAAWAHAGGIEAVPLRLGPGPCSAEALRRRRRRALAEAARGAGALHLLLGQHRLDQAETVLLRAMRGSGGRGLAAMAPVATLGPVRLVRPLLGVSPRAIRAFLAARHQPWTMDPANDTRGARAALRQAMADRDGEGAGAMALAGAAARRAASRLAEEAAVASLLARAASLLPDQGVALDRSAMLSADSPLRAAALAAVMAGLSGSAHPPGPSRLAVAAGKLAGEAAFSLGGCVLRPAGGAWIVRPEQRRVVAVAETRGLGYTRTSGGEMAADAASHPEGVKSIPRR